MLHEVARHAIHSFETLSIAVETLGALQQHVLHLSNENTQSTGKPTNESYQIRVQVDFQARMLQNLLLRSQSNKERLQNEIALVGTTIPPRVTSHIDVSLGVQHDCPTRQSGDDGSGRGSEA